MSGLVETEYSHTFSYLLFGADSEFWDGHFIELFNDVICQEGEATPPVSALSPHDVSPLSLVLVETSSALINTSLTDPAQYCMEIEHVHVTTPYLTNVINLRTCMYCTWAVDASSIWPLPLGGVVITFTHWGLFKILCKKKHFTHLAACTRLLCISYIPGMIPRETRSENYMYYSVIKHK